MPAWYNSLPESVKVFESTRDAAIISYEITHTQDWITTGTVAAIATTATSSTSSSSNGQGILIPTNGVMMPVAGAVGVAGIALSF
ncbi:hypothetical protein N7462_009451 [Penicillium macrosclerotiorum]|uniref:uncharacterized protein n=1 Tax=Penicillium macrosclerotiorum TaxID=303699 RepID=UPI002548A83B|nr:uncharacterized protein N7462_009451 [Penicillium macrosclerotiorum]KAJ5674012.1 hypothetical protein N7462_009451 [Penicillium macrosclerotiorum]